MANNVTRAPWHGKALSWDHTRIGGVEAWVVWSLATVFVVWLFSIQTGYGIVSPDIQVSADLSLAQISLAGSIYTWAFATCQFFSGSLLDRFGSSPLMTIGVALVTAGAFLYAWTPNYAVLVLAQVVMAIGASFGFVGAGYIGGVWFAAASYGLMFGLVQMFASLGSAVGQPAISLLLRDMDWNQLLAGFGVFGIVLVVLFVLLVRNPKPAPGASAAAADQGPLVHSILSELGTCFRNRQVVLSSVLAGVSFGSMLAVGTLWGPRIMGARDASPELAAALTGMAWLGLAVGAPLFNVISNRMGSRRLPAAIGIGLQAVAAVLVIYLPDESKGAAIALMFALGLFAGAHMLGFTVAGESVAGGLVGSSAAIVNGVCFIIGGLLMSIPGAFLSETPDLDDYQSVLWLIPAVLVLGIVASLMLRDTHPSR